LPLATKHVAIVVFRHTVVDAGMGRKQCGVRRARIGRLAGRARFFKFLQVRGEFKFCVAGVEKTFKHAQNSTRSVGNEFFEYCTVA